jgi:putative transposase
LRRALCAFQAGWLALTVLLAGHGEDNNKSTAGRSVDLLADNGIAISMDGKGAWRDNVFVERLWRSVKYEQVYLATRSADTSTSTMAADPIRALTAPLRIKPTSTNRHSAWRLNPGRRSTYRCGDSVQTTGTSSGQAS